MALEEIREQDVVVLVPDTNLAVPKDCNDLVKALAGVLEAKETLLVLDCEKVGRLGAAGLRVLLRTKKKLKTAGGRVFLCSMNEKVRQAFDISGFDREFEIATTRAEAVRRAKEAPVAAAEEVAPEPAAEATPDAPEPAPAEAPGDPVAQLLVEALGLPPASNERDAVPASVVELALGVLGQPS